MARNEESVRLIATPEDRARRVRHYNATFDAMGVPMMVNKTPASFGHLTIEFVDAAPLGGPFTVA